MAGFTCVITVISLVEGWRNRFRAFIVFIRSIHFSEGTFFISPQLWQSYFKPSAILFVQSVIKTQLATASAAAATPTVSLSVSFVVFPSWHCFRNPDALDPRLCLVCNAR